jgi:hypothetical protein
MGVDNYSWETIMATDAKVAEAKLQFIQLFTEMGADTTISDETVRMMVDNDEARQREEMLQHAGKLLHFPSAAGAV